MADVDEQLRQGMEALADLADSDGVLQQVIARRGRRRRARLARLAAIGAVLLVVGAIGVSRLVTGDDPPAEVAAGLRPARGQVPAGMQAVSYHGIELYVPDTWTINDQHCGTPQHDTVLIPQGMMLGCLVPQPPGLTVVTVGPIDHGVIDPWVGVATEAVTVDGSAARRGRGVPPEFANVQQPVAERSVLVLPAVGLVISVESPDVDLAESLLDLVRLAPVDHNGCRDRVPSLTPPDADDRSGPEDQLARPGPTTAVICRYNDLWLARSVPVSPTEVEHLVDLLNTLPTEVPDRPRPEYEGYPAEICSWGYREGFVIQLTYADESATDVYAEIGGMNGCGLLFAGNGRRTAGMSGALLTFLVDAAGYDGGFEDPRLLP